jgi:hypothetical protein
VDEPNYLGGEGLAGEWGQASSGEMMMAF